MIAKAKAIRHGSSMTSYTMRRDRLQPLKVNLLSKEADAHTLWAMMKLHQEDTRHLRAGNHELKNTALRIEISPLKEETLGWTDKDWTDLADEFIREMDGVEFDRNDPKYKGVRHTNIANSQYILTRHDDSRSGTVHLHLVVNRVDDDGQVNCDKHIGERASIAADRINLMRGWKLPSEIRKRNVMKITEDCLEILRRMSIFVWKEYEKELIRKGYSFHLRTDSKGDVVGYCICIGRSRFNASDIGHGRNLTARHISGTWERMHPAISERHDPGSTSGIITITPSEERRFVTSYNVEGKVYSIDIKASDYLEIKRNISRPEDNEEASHNDILKTAVLLFLGYIDAATSIAESSGGGGCSSDMSWGRDKDEDDLQYSRRCAYMASRMFNRPVRRGMRR